MFPKVLLPTDGSPRAAEALEFARHLALRFGVREALSCNIIRRKAALPAFWEGERRVPIIAWLDRTGGRATESR